ncbi:MAG: potassium-transporting ATPase subunit KdpA [Planctomycetes bacterium]|nr:potassium-transporting ATPase subunit KdpA [Planctomycetota bacterium]
MAPPDRYINPFASRPTRRPRHSTFLKRAEIVLVCLGLIATVMHHGLRNLTRTVQWELGTFLVLVLAFLSVSIALRYRWSLARPTFFSRHRAEVIPSALWLTGFLGVLIFGRALPEWLDVDVGRGLALVVWSEVCLVLRALAQGIRFTRRITAFTREPALVLVASFGLLIGVGTGLLMLPRSYASPETMSTSFTNRLRVALFTATSASCVTGLTVVDTGGENPYWSRGGQVVILALFQVGGLGIMTFGAFFALAAGGVVPVRERATMAELLESEQLGDVRRLVLAILGFTAAAEIVGAVLLSGLWADLPLGERIFQSAFHSVSAFCNAGFALTPDSFVGWGGRWQVWGVAAGLIIIGGLGFATLYNVVLFAWSRASQLRRDPLFGLPKAKVRLSLSSRLVLVTTGFLLVAGTAAFYVLEAAGRTVAAASGRVSSTDTTAPEAAESARPSVADAWFQSVTVRTAGFNTVDHAALEPGTRLCAIGLMFIGASPGSTGGGIKTTCFALAVLGLMAILRGRPQTEVYGRSVPDVVVKRAFAVLTLALAAVVTTTLLLVVFERRPERFLDHLFEATSAFGTVGLSSIGTKNLTAPSQMVIAVTMFLGRVGPLTLLIALAGRSRPARYEYPVERVTLG